MIGIVVGCIGTYCESRIWDPNPRMVPVSDYPNHLPHIQQVEANLKLTRYFFPSVLAIHRFLNIRLSPVLRYLLVTIKSIRGFLRSSDQA